VSRREELLEKLAELPAAECSEDSVMQLFRERFPGELEAVPQNDDTQKDLLQQLKDVLEATHALQIRSSKPLAHYPEAEIRIVARARHAGVKLMANNIYEVARWVLSQSYVEFRVLPSDVANGMFLAGYITEGVEGRLCYNLPCLASPLASADVAQFAMPQLCPQPVLQLAGEKQLSSGDIRRCFLVPQSAVSEIIGIRGVRIRALSAFVGCRIELERARTPGMQNCSVTGTAPKVLLAELAIKHIEKYSYHPFADHNVTHVEVPLYKGDPEIRFVIGVNGREMRHIQNSYGVRVLIPQRHSSEDSKVVVLGANPKHVEGANNYIRKLLPRAREAEEAETARGMEVEEDSFWEAIDKQIVPMKSSPRGEKNASAQRTRAKAAPRNLERHGVEEGEKEKKRKMEQREMAKNRNRSRNLKYAS